MKITDVVMVVPYAGMTLTIYRNEAGVPITPLKAIAADLLGLQWKTQAEKVKGSPFLTAELGVSTPLMGGRFPENQAPICIRLDRVPYYMMTVNPDRVRANGNVSGAEFLEQKIREWADYLHDLEEVGIAVNHNHQNMIDDRRKQDAALCQLIGVKNKCEDLQDRRLVSARIKVRAEEMGIPYQSDLVDGA